MLLRRKRYEPTTWKEKKIDELMTRWLWATSEEAKTIENEIYLIVEGLYTVTTTSIEKRKIPKRERIIKRGMLKEIGMVCAIIFIGVLALMRIHLRITLCAIIFIGVLVLTLMHPHIMENFNGVGNASKVTTVKIGKIKDVKMYLVESLAREKLKEKYSKATTTETVISYPGPCGKMDCELAKTIFTCVIQNNEKIVSVGSSTVLTCKGYLGKPRAFLNAFYKLNLSLSDYELIAETNS